MAKTDRQTEIKKIKPLSLGKIAAALYFIFGVVSAILILVMQKAAANIPVLAANLASLEQLSTGMLLLMPFWQALIGFLAGVIVAWLYNLLAGKLGGIKIELY